MRADEAVVNPRSKHTITIVLRTKTKTKNESGYAPFKDIPHVVEPLPPLKLELGIVGVFVG